MYFEKQYLQKLDTLLKTGSVRHNRTGIDTLSLFGAVLSHSMGKGFPLLTTKRVYFKGCVHELLWMLSGSTNIEYLNSNGVHIWDPWADKNGDLGPVYGKQWTSWGPDGVNKVFNVQELIKNDPYSRRIIINAWNVGELDKMALPPCHILFQFYPEPTTRRLSLIVYMRSADIFLGLPFDVAEGALLLQMMSAVTGYYPDMLTYMVGDLHLYVNHVEQAKKQLKRNYRPVPNLTIPVRDSVFEYQYEDFVLAGYEPHDAIKVEVAV